MARGKRIPIIISLALILIAGGVFYILLTSKWLKLTDGELINSLIAIFACLGALISVTFVIYSYMMTNYAFVLSQKPFLLIQVVNEKVAIEDSRTVPRTVIHYENITKNTFFDLTMNIRVCVFDKEIDISDLFTLNMYMAGGDKRDRRFKPIELLSEHGVDINAETHAGNPVILKIGYRYTFNKKIETFEVQEYEWKASTQTWDIR